MKKIGIYVGALSLLLPFASHATVIGFVNNPTTNLEDWTSAVTGAGGTVVTNADFDNPTAGATITTTGAGGVLFGAGPGDGNTFSPPVSTGEGPNSPSNYYSMPSPGTGGPGSSMTVSFASPVFAAGLDTIDYFGASGFNNFLTLSAYTGADATGTLLGSFSSVQFNFQDNNIYFMGIESTAGDIGSIVFSRASDDTGDVVGLDNIVSAGAAAAPVPEPASLTLLGASVAGLGWARRRKRR